MPSSKSTPKGAVIFLHGSGGNGRDLGWVLRSSGFQEELSDMQLELICPTAPARPYTMAGGMQSNVWFDRTDLHPAAREDAAGADASYQMLRGILDKLQAEKGISSSSVFVGGFSMGGGMALEFLARHHPVQLAGVFGFGSFLATGSSVYGRLGDGLQTPVLLGHGQADSAVRHEWGLTTARRLSEIARAASTPRVGFYSFPRLDHELEHRELAVLLGWLRTGGAVYPDAAPLNTRFARLGGVVQEALGPAEAQLAMAVVEGGSAADGSRSATATFHVPEAAVPLLVAKSIAARGAHFSFVRGPELGTVQVTFTSPHPQEVAEVLRDRILARLQDPEGANGGAEAVCPTS